MAQIWIDDRNDHAGYREAVAKAKAAKRKIPGRWKVRWTDPAGNAKSKTFGTLPPAEAFKRRLEAELNGDDGAQYVDPAARAVPLADVAESWFAAKSPSWEPRTRRNYRDILDGYVIPKFGATPIGAIGYEDAAAWLADLLGKPGLTGSDKRKVGPARVRLIHVVLTGVLDFAVRSGRLHANPIARLDTLPAKPAPRRLYLTHEQVDALASAVGNLETNHRPPRPVPGRDMCRVLVLTLAYCGLRIGEALALKAGSVDIEARRVDVVEAYGEDDDGKLALGLPKGGKTRVVGLPVFLVDELKPFVASRDDGELVFTSPQGGPIRAHNFRPRIFNPAVAKAKLPKAITPHSLRHTFASLSVAAGADVKTLQAAMGHATAAMTLDVYADLFPARVGEVADALDSGRSKALGKISDRPESVPEPPKQQ